MFLSVGAANVPVMGFTERFMRPGGVVAVAEWQVKQYLVGVAFSAVEAATVAAAVDYLLKLLPAGNASDPTPKVAFSVLHKGMDAVWLNLYAWVYGEILHCRAASAAFATPTEFVPLSEPLIGCVWELPARVHERSAGVRPGLAPHEPPVDAYLADVLPEGPVGGP